MDFEKRKRDYERFNGELEVLGRRYMESKSTELLADGIRRMAENSDYHPFAHFFIIHGNACIRRGDWEGGIACMKAAKESFPDIFDYVPYYLRMAQYHIEKGETDAGVEFLLRMCREEKNYSVYIKVNELTDVWEKYKSLFADRFPELLEEEQTVKEDIVYAVRLKTPAECEKPIAEILALPDDEILNELSIHLQELTGNGDVIQALNKWERTAYYVDELCMEVNSGGFEGYLYYHGAHFEKAYKALEQMGAGQMTALLDRVREKFPRNRIPKTADSIQNTLDRMEEKGVVFEAEDDCYYGGTERELLERLTAWVRNNEKRFR